MRTKLNELLSQYPEFEKLAEETEEMRCQVDKNARADISGALKLMIDIDTNMIRLMSYHVQLSTECLKLNKVDHSETCAHCSKLAEAEENAGCEFCIDGETCCDCPECEKQKKEAAKLPEEPGLFE